MCTFTRMWVGQGKPTMAGRLRFVQLKKAERRGRNPATGKDMMLAPRKVVTFKWSGMLKNKLNSKNRSKKEAEMTKKKERDIQKTYTTKQMVAKLRRLADSLENGKQYKIQIAGEKISRPTKTVFNIEHERGKKTEEVEFQFKWEL